MLIEKNEDGTYKVSLGIAAGIRKDGVMIPIEVMEREIARINERGGVLSELGYPATHILENYWVTHARLQDLHEDRMCGKITDLCIVPGDTATVVGTFKPSGSFGGVAKVLLEKDLSNVKFGMRAFVNPTSAKRPMRTLGQIVTWDLIQKEQE
jgi:hypothetical protein